MKRGVIAGPGNQLPAENAEETLARMVEPPLRFEARGNLSPFGMAVQRAFMRRDRDGRTRMEKFGEMAVKKAVAGEINWATLVLDRFIGKVVPLAADGSNKDELQPVLLQALVEALVEKKLAPVLVGSARVTDVIEQAIRDKE